MNILAPMISEYSKKNYMMVLSTEIDTEIEGIEPGFGYTIFKVYELTPQFADLIQTYGKYIIAVRMTWGYDYIWKGSFRFEKNIWNDDLKKLLDYSYCK